MLTFDVDIRRASYLPRHHPSVHAGTRGAPKLALRELPRGAVVFAVGALDSYLSNVSAEVMIYQCQQDDVTGDTRTIMRTVSQLLHGLALGLAITEDATDRVDRLRSAIVDHLQTPVSFSVFE